MSVTVRDYSIVGAESARALERGLANGEWFQANIEPARLRELMERSNVRAGIDMAIWFALIAGTAVLAWNLRDGWLAVPAFLAYGALVGGSSDARWHECGHGTAFKTSWLNDLVYYPASFMIAREPTYWRWSHFRHHTDTIVVGRDPEIIFPRPPSFGQVALTFANITGGPRLMLGTIGHAFSGVAPAVAEIVPEAEWQKVVREARVMVAIWIGVIALAVATTSILPVLYIGGPTIYGAWLMVFFGVTQHAGLQEDVLDHRFSTRTVKMNPIFRFLYLNMNYHVEHHMFPAVPYRALPELHDEISEQLPMAAPSTLAAYREIFRAIRHQSKDPTWELDRNVPDVQAASGQIVQAFNWLETDGWLDVGRDDLGAGELRSVVVGDTDCVIARTEDGTLCAVARRCTHGEADLGAGLVVQNEIECPKHNGRFSLTTGAPTRRPVQEPLRTFPIRSKNGRMQMEVQ